MTVIAYDGRVVAADTAMYDGQRRMVATSRKIIPLARGDDIAVFSAAGCASGGMEALRWFVERDLDRSSMPACNGGVTMAIMRRGRPIEGYELGPNVGSPEPYIEEAPFAYGSGGNHARGFLDASDNVIAAVRSACKWIGTCHEPIEAFDLSAGEWLTKIDTSDLYLIERIVNPTSWRIL